MPLIRTNILSWARSSLPDVFLGKDVLKICSKFTGKHQCQSALLVQLLCNFFEMALPHGCSPVNLQHIFKTTFTKNMSEVLLLMGFQQMRKGTNILQTGYHTTMLFVITLKLYFGENIFFLGTCVYHL